MNQNSMIFFECRLRNRDREPRVTFGFGQYYRFPNISENESSVEEMLAEIKQGQEICAEKQTELDLVERQNDQNTRNMERYERFSLL